MIVCWTSLVKLAGGENGRYIGQCPITGKHRVQTFKFRGRPVAPPVGDEGRDYTATTWLLDDEGRCRGDLAPCDQDYAGTA